MSQEALAVGDVFRLKPFDGARCGYGQILATHGSSSGHFWFGIFRNWYRGTQARVEDVVDDDLALVGLSIDSLLFHGDWQVVGTAPLPPVQLPRDQEVVAPIRLQHAFESLAGARPWLPAYDRLRH